MSDLLFYGTDLFSFIETRKRSLEGEVAALPREQLVGADLAKLTEEFAQRYIPAIPVLRPAEKTGSSEDVEIDISGDPTRMFFHMGIGPPRVRGTRITIDVPFDGDPELFSIKPNTYNLNPPRGEVRGQAVSCRIEETDINQDKVKSAFESWLRDVEQYLNWHRSSQPETTRKLTAAAMDALQQRSTKLNAASNALTGLGIALNSAARPAAAPTRVPSPPQDRARATPAHFDCFVSYAGEDRDLVRKLVDALSAKGVTAWWDKAQITLGDSLIKKIDEGLNRSRYGLIVVSKSFIAKPWPQSELRALHQRAMSSGRKVLLPVLVEIDHAQFASTYPLLSDIVTTTFHDDLAHLVGEILAAIER